jgi:hypothetical protein
MLPALLVLHPGKRRRRRTQVLFKAPPGTSKIRRHVLEVGDVPRHQMRIAELQSVR